MSFKDRVRLRFIKIIESKVFAVVAIGLIIGAIFFTVFWAAKVDQQKWNKFSKDNNCKLVEHHEPKTSTAFINGEFTYITTPAEDVYECNGMRFSR